MSLRHRSMHPTATQQDAEKARPMKLVAVGCIQRWRKDIHAPLALPILSPPTHTHTLSLSLPAPVSLSLAPLDRVLHVNT